MNVIIESNFPFSVASIGYSASGELRISLNSDDAGTGRRFCYEAQLDCRAAEERSMVGLLEYARRYMERSTVKESTKGTYKLMCNYLEAYGDCLLERVNTEYLEGFVAYLHSRGLGQGTVRLHFQKLTCVLHDAYRNGLFDDRVLQRVKRPKKVQTKKCFLTEAELKRMMRHPLPEEYGNIMSMFLFSCLTGLRFGDVLGLRWKDVKRNGKHLQLEFHQQKTDTHERLPLCADAEALLHGMERKGEHVFDKVTNPYVNATLRKWCKEAKIKKPVTFHIARHTFCVLLLTKEVPIFTVQQLMCHSDIGTTQVYADLMNSTMAKAVKKLPRLEQ
ncbi:MAG: site-specific integrase [Bacteroidales bacterium]|nr:site-specific integrase [Bacteroidales bacterium]